MRTIREILAAVPDSCLKIFDINLRQQYYDGEMIHTSLELCHILKINDEELQRAAELFRLAGNPREIMKQLAARYELKAIILTLGAKGSMLFDGRSFTEYPVIPCKVVDTVGCGDAFLAAWCASVIRGESLEQAMRAGTERSALVAGRKGAME